MLARCVRARGSLAQRALSWTPACRLQHAEADASSSALDDAAESFRESVHEFAQKQVAPHAAEIDATNAFPKHVNLWTAMGDFGLHGKGTGRTRTCTTWSLLCVEKVHSSLDERVRNCAPGVTVPEEYGGLDLGYLHHCIAMEVQAQDVHPAPLIASCFYTLLCCKEWLVNTVAIRSVLLCCAGAEPRVGLRGAELRRAQQPVHKSGRAERQRGAEGQVPAQAADRQAGPDGTESRLYRSYASYSLPGQEK